mmetsp:Transcript_111256/g.193028  ORF Transcript_111256/g.193028 Transcript_111256/m.193028 type:complete len:210 (+) Transcript_111256:2234-2863(+)
MAPQLTFGGLGLPPPPAVDVGAAGGSGGLSSSGDEPGNMPATCFQSTLFRLPCRPLRRMWDRMGVRRGAVSAEVGLLSSPEWGGGPASGLGCSVRGRSPSSPRGWTSSLPPVVGSRPAIRDQSIPIDRRRRGLALVWVGSTTSGWNDTRRFGFGAEARRPSGLNSGLWGLWASCRSGPSRRAESDFRRGLPAGTGGSFGMATGEDASEQ